MKLDLTVQKSKIQMREVNRCKISGLRSKQLSPIKLRFNFSNKQKTSQHIIVELNRSQTGLYLAEINELQNRHFHA